MSNNNSQNLIQEVSEALIDKLGVSKASAFWSFFGCGKKDYTKLRKDLFKGEKSASLYKKIKASERK